MLYFTIIFIVKVYDTKTQDITNFHLENLSPVIATDYRSPKEIHIYSNYPNTPTVLENYEEVSRNIHYNPYRKSRFLTTNTEPSMVYMQSQKYSEINNRYTEVPLEEPLTPHEESRPKFKTKHTEHPTFSNIQKINKTQKQQSRSRQTNINNILKRYITKLYAQKQNGPSNTTLRLPNSRLNRTENEVKSKIFFDAPLTALKNKTVSFANKFLSLFTVVQFPNSKCQASSASTGYEGTCYHQSQCDQMNGTATGECANGYGVCCVFKFTCGESSSQNCTYFESPGYPDYYPPGGGTVSPILPPPTVAPEPPPTPDPRDQFNDQFYHHLQRTFKQDNSDSLSCIFSVFRQSDDVQQMRIDFLDLELLGPTDGDCVNERLVISGQNLNDPIPPICGYNTGHHVYVDVGNLNGPLQLAILSNSVYRKRFQIRICQVASSCSTSQNCLQYYTGVQGVISTFNYDQAAIYSRSQPGYFNDLNYAICVRREAGYCSITYTNVQGSTEYPFQLINIDDDAESTVPQGQAGVDILNCPEDYVIINGVRLCGDKFNDGSVVADFTMNAPVTDTNAGPIVISVRTDEILAGRGFKLFYIQNPCSTF